MNPGDPFDFPTTSSRPSRAPHPSTVPPKVFRVPAEDDPTDLRVRPTDKPASKEDAAWEAM